MTRNAFIVLEAAEADAQAEPIEAPPAVRLALAWMLASGIAERWQAVSFFEAMTDPPPETDHQRWLFDYCRHRDMALILSRWQRVAEDQGFQLLSCPTTDQPSA